MSTAKNALADAQSESLTDPRNVGDYRSANARAGAGPQDAGENVNLWICQASA